MPSSNNYYIIVEIIFLKLKFQIIVSVIFFLTNALTFSRTILILKKKSTLIKVDCRVRRAPISKSTN